MAKTLSSLVGGGAFPFVNEIPWAAGSPALLKNLDAYFGNTVANQQKLGHGFQWFSADASIPTTWTNYLSLTGPGCIDFLAVYMESGADADDVEMRIDIDGNTGPVMPNMWTASSQISDGHILIGCVPWDNAAEAPLVQTIEFEPLYFSTGFDLYMQGETGTVSNYYEGIYRWYETQ
jgi:hypothetical protein